MPGESDSAILIIGQLADIGRAVSGIAQRLNARSQGQGDRETEMSEATNGLAQAALGAAALLDTAAATLRSAAQSLTVAQSELKAEADAAFATLGAAANAAEAAADSAADALDAGQQAAAATSEAMRGLLSELEAFAAAQQTAIDEKATTLAHDIAAAETGITDAAQASTARLGDAAGQLREVRQEWLRQASLEVGNRLGGAVRAAEERWVATMSSMLHQPLDVAVNGFAARVQTEVSREVSQLAQEVQREIQKMMHELDGLTSSSRRDREPIQPLLDELGVLQRPLEQLMGSVRDIARTVGFSL